MTETRGAGAVVGPAQIRAASNIIAGEVRRTPIMRVESSLFDVACAQLDLKLELLQHTGSFKPRGAMHRAMTSEVPSSGLIAASGGNHGLAVAWVAQRRGVPAEIFVPEVSPAAKVDKIRALGATVHVTGALYDDALAACRARQTETGALDIHAYDHVDTIAGAGTIAQEIDEDLGAIDTVLVSLGGGGLSSGIAAWFATTPTSIVVVEPERSQCFGAAVAAGEPVDVTVGGVAADSLGARRVGSTNWEVLDAASAVSVVVPDDAIRATQHRFWAKMQLVVEPGGAAAAAALISGAYRPGADERVAVIVCGANCDPASVQFPG